MPSKFETSDGKSSLSGHAVDTLARPHAIRFTEIELVSVVPDKVPRQVVWFSGSMALNHAEGVVSII